MSTGPHARQHAFSLAEALLSLLLLQLVAVVAVGLFCSGLQSAEQNADWILLDSHARSRMEWLIAEDFDTLAGGSDVVDVNGQNYSVTWTVATVDLDGDATPELTAKQINVSVGGRSLTTIVIDTSDRLTKI